MQFVQNKIEIMWARIKHNLFFHIAEIYKIDFSGVFFFTCLHMRK